MYIYIYICEGGFPISITHGLWACTGQRLAIALYKLPWYPGIRIVHSGICIYCICKRLLGVQGRERHVGAVHNCWWRIRNKQGVSTISFCCMWSEFLISFDIGTFAGGVGFTNERNAKQWKHTKSELRFQLLSFSLPQKTPSHLRKSWLHAISICM